MVGRQKDSQRVFDSKKQFKSNGPKQAVDVLIVTVSKWQYATARLAFQILKDGFAGASLFAICKLMHRIARQRYGLPKLHLPHIDRKIRFRVHSVG